MLAKNIIGTLILLFNIIGLGYLFFKGFQTLRERFFKGSASQADSKNLGSSLKKRPVVVNENDIIPESEDLLKDMDLSDLDKLNLDDFE